MAGQDARARVLFICVGNAVRSQMAEGFARALGGDAVDARSGGSAPAGFVAPKALIVMRERGVDLRGHASKGIDWTFLEQAHAVVSTCREAEAACPIAFPDRTIRWEVRDPSGRGVEAYREVRDEVEVLVRALLEDMGVRAAKRS